MTFRQSQVTANAADPLHDRPASSCELFARVAGLADGFPRDAVIDVALNLLVNAVRQQAETAAAASDALDAYTTAARRLLLERHYYPGCSGRRRGVFPFTQVIDLPFLGKR